MRRNKKGTSRSQCRWSRLPLNNRDRSQRHTVRNRNGAGVKVGAGVRLAAVGCIEDGGVGVRAGDCHAERRRYDTAQFRRTPARGDRPTLTSRVVFLAFGRLLEENARGVNNGSLTILPLVMPGASAPVLKESTSAPEALWSTMVSPEGEMPNGAVSAVWRVGCDVHSTTR